jgi:hypothetical protein
VSSQFDLDAAASPEAVVGILHRFAQRAFDDSGELESAWQSRSAGRPWTIIGRELYAAAERIERALRRSGYPYSGQARARHPRTRGDRLSASKRHPGRKRARLEHPNRAHSHRRGGKLVACSRRG